MTFPVLSAVILQLLLPPGLFVALRRRSKASPGQAQLDFPVLVMTPMDSIRSTGSLR